MRLLLLNPNTSVQITERLVASARSALFPGDYLHAETAQVGPLAIRSEAQALEAADRIVAMADAFGAAYDAVLVGISLDCGLAAARERLAPKPVIGMTQAACLSAGLYGSRFGLLTIGSAMAPLYQAHIETLGLGAALVGIRAPDLPQAFSASASDLSEEVLQALTAGSCELIAQGAQSVVLAGAVLCGYAEALQARLERPVLDGMRCAVLQARVHVNACGYKAPLA